MAANSPLDLATKKKGIVYFRISEAARILGVSASSLRNWERMGLVTAARSQGRYRLYSQDALKRLTKIRYLRTVQHVNPAGIVAMLEERHPEQWVPSEARKRQEAIAQ